MDNILELCTAGVVVHLPLGGSISLPYLPWMPETVTRMTEDDLEAALRHIRLLRDKAMPKG